MTLDPCDPCGCIPPNIGKADFYNRFIKISCEILSAVTVGPPVAESLIPSADNTWDIGSASKRWKDLYMSGDLTFSGLNSVPSTFLIHSNTSDGSDNTRIDIAGGGAASSSRGAYLELSGNEGEGNGRALIVGGNISTGVIELQITNAAASIQFANSSGLTMWSVNNSGQIVQNGANGSDIVFNNTNGLISQGTADGSDNHSIALVGGGASGSSRGGGITVYGNEVVTTGGSVVTQGGTISTGNIDHVLGNASAAWRFINASAATVINMTNAGSISISATGVSNEVAISDGTVTGKIRTVTGDRFYVGTSSAHNLALMTSGSLRWGINTSGQLTQDSSNGGDIVFGQADFKILTSTADGSDNRQVTVASGGGASDTRGAYIQLSGNEQANTGSVQLVAGNAAGGVINFNAGGATQHRILSGFAFQNVAAGNESTGAGIVNFGANAPATVATPYTWLKIKTSDGTTAFIPVWK